MKFPSEVADDFRKSGLEPRTVEEHGLRVVPVGDIRKILGPEISKGVEHLLEFPYANLNGSPPLSRYKLFPPGLKKNDEGEEEPVGYFQKKGSGARLYLPRGTAEKLADPSVSLNFIEGEKKTLAAWQADIPCPVGVSGVWGWRNKETRKPIEDLDHINFKGRTIEVFFDGDVFAFSNGDKKREGLMQGAFAFLKECEERGAASVRLVELPAGEGGEKTGLDDFLVAKGHEALKALPRVGSDDPRFDAARNWWQGWKQKKAVESQNKKEGGISEIIKKIEAADSLAEKQPLFAMLCRAAARLTDGEATLTRETCRRLGFTVKSFDALFAEERKRLAIERAEEEKRKRDEAMRLEIERLATLPVSLEDIERKLSAICSSPYAFGGVKIVMATALGTACKECVPLWIFLVSVPSGAKTFVAELLRPHPNTYFLDTLTENSLITGFIPEGGEIPQDLLSQLDDRLFIVKELSALFSQHHDTVKKILGDFTAVYDGSFAKFTGTRGLVSYNTKFNWVACITHAALSEHQGYMSLIGGRVMFCRFLKLSDKEKTDGYRILKDESTLRKKEELAEMVCAITVQLAKKMQEGKLPEVTPEADERLEKLAEFLARGRAVMKTEKVEKMSEKDGKTSFYFEYEISGSPQIEEPFRAYLQLRGLARLLAFIDGKTEVKKEDLRLVGHVVFSTMPVERSKIIEALLTWGDGDVTRDQLGKRVGRSYNPLKRTLLELEATGLVVQDKSSEGGHYLIRLADDYGTLLSGLDFLRSEEMGGRE